MKDNSICPLNKEQFHVAMRLYPYVFWADLLRTQFETAFTHDRETLLLQTEQNIDNYAALCKRENRGHCPRFSWRGGEEKILYAQL
jgi:hypothetical protein